MKSISPMPESSELAGADHLTVAQRKEDMRGAGRRSTVLGVVALAVLSAVLLTATAAQAFTKGEFRVGGKTFAEKGVNEETAAGTVPLGFLNIPGLKFKIHCETAKASGTLEKGGGASATGLFEGCTVEGAKCTVYNNYNEKTEKFEGEGMITASGSGEVGLHAGVHYARAASPEFTTVYLSDPGGKCTLPEENAISGSAAARLPKALEELVNQPIADINEAEEKLLEVALFFGAEPAFIEVEAEGSVHLTGANAENTFGSQ